MGDPAGAVDGFRLGKVTGVFLALHMLDDGGTRPRIFDDVDGAAADHGAAGGAGAQFSESHSYRHSDAPCLVGGKPLRYSRRIGETCIRPRRRMTKTGWSASALTTMGLGIARQMAGSATSVPLRNKAAGGVNGPPAPAAGRSRIGPRDSRRDSGCPRTSEPSAQRQICHAWALKWGVNFSAYLSDLFCPFVTRIGALGLTPTYSRTTRGRQLGICRR